MPVAEGWRAVYRYETEVVMLPIVCWVLTEYCDDTRAVVGWVAEGTDVDRADSDSYTGFDYYLGPGCKLPKVPRGPVIIGDACRKCGAPAGLGGATYSWLGVNRPGFSGVLVT
jgi:hypothetical protein